MSRDILMARTKTGLMPATPDDDKRLAEMADLGAYVMVAIRKPRSPQQLRLWWALVEMVAPNTDYETKEALAAAIKLAVGAYDVVRELDGTLTKAPKSIALGSMPQDEFNEFFEATIDIICRDVLPGVSKDDLRRDVLRLVGAGHDAAAARVDEAMGDAALKETER